MKKYFQFARIWMETDTNIISNLNRSTLHFYIPSKFYNFGFELFVVIFDFHYFLP